MVVVVFVVSVVIVVIASVRCCEVFGRLITRMLAMRAARSICGGGGAREMKVCWVVGAGFVVVDGQVVDGSWSEKYRLLNSSAVICTVWLVPGWGRGKMKEAMECSLSSSAKGLSHENGEG